MKTIIPYFSIFLIPYAATYGFSGPAPKPTPTVTVSPPPTGPGVGAGFKFVPSSSHTKAEVEKVKRAERLVNELAQSLCVADYFQDTKTRSQLIQTNGKSRSEVVAHIRSLSLTIPVVMYYKSNSTVGYTYPNVATVWTNRKFHQNYSACPVASNLGHEALHKAGYGHDSKVTARRPYSVPYTWNAATNKCCPSIDKALAL